MKLHFVTSNKSKVREAQMILEFPIEPVHLELEEIQSLSMEEIVEHKVRQAYEKIKQPVIVDDAGLFFEEWNGFPGPFVKFVGGNDKLLHLLRNETNRHVTIKAGVGFTDGKDTAIFMGEVHGLIPQKEQGEGFGWDPIFIPDGYDKTFAELGIEEKNKMSHRKRALEKFNAFLKEQKYSFS